jgi:hypothetical protein
MTHKFVMDVQCVETGNSRVRRLLGRHGASLISYSQNHGLALLEARPGNIAQRGVNRFP